MSELATKPPRPASEPLPPPAAEVRRSHGISLVWLIPLVAAVIAGWLAWNTYANEGPQITLSFESADGLEPGKTKIKYRDVDVGTVQTVRISPDLKQIIVRARMVEEAGPYLTTGTRYWIVRPRVGTGGVSGLGTLVSGAYIEVDPGSGDYARDFTGLEEPPELRSNIPGRTFTLRADSLGSLGRGAPIYYRGIEAGQVLGYDLVPGNRESLRVNIFVRSPYDRLVYAQTRFWNASGLSVSTDTGGIKLHMASVQSLLGGGVEFSTPSGFTDAEPAATNSEFVLFPDADAATQAEYTQRVPFLVEFEGDTRGLRTGASVEVRGIRVGSVADLRLAYSQQRRSLLIQAVIEIEPQRIQAVDADTNQPIAQDSMETLVSRGLRAQLKTANLLTGDLYVDLDFQPTAPKAEMRTVDGKAVIPSVPTQLETIQASATSVLEKIAALPLPELVQSLTSTAKSIETTVGSPQVSEAVANLSQSMASLRATAEQAGPLVGSLKATSDAAAATLKQAQSTLATVGPNAALGTDLRALIDELQGAARSIRTFADYLDRHPEALLRGKRGGYE